MSLQRKSTTISVIIPVYNEQNTITPLIKKVFSSIKTLQNKLIRFEVIIVNDGSSDNTLSQIKKLKNQHRFRLISHPQNQGKGSSLISGFNQAKGDIFITQDADLEYNQKSCMGAVYLKLHYL
jgi:glycosyltransferase involved in cell wall biosynthesis